MGLLTWFFVLLCVGGFIHEAYPATNTVLYTVKVVTADEIFAGTDSHVFLRIYGDLGDTGEIELNSDGNDFEKGATDEFRFVGKYVGSSIRKVAVKRSDSMFGNWKLEEISVKGTSPLFFKFHFNQWIPADRWIESYG
ncbi:lipoxygenase homology domain-containing protein 1 [Nematostella vectensis]|uniref:lipoxygenase homology domain-containing protein 1 n=1 Tax=Nematostella vectensis TaxID=45351 RepID=UPI00138FB6EA|nr:lipoxygenase homology domain-containing protein 1 [Nematostella vectensis]